MTIREYIIEKEIAHTSERLEALCEMEAPKILIDRLEQEIAKLRRGNLDIGGDRELLDIEFANREVRKGNGGKIYIQFDGKVNYFPQARYGRYIKEVTV